MIREKEEIIEDWHKRVKHGDKPEDVLFLEVLIDIRDVLIGIESDVRPGEVTGGYIKP